MAPHFPDCSIAYVELYVADAVQALEFLTGALAFTACALAEHPDRYSVLLASGSARLIVTEPRGGGAVAEWLSVHGDGVRDVALYRSDVGAVVERARQAGLPVLRGPSPDAATGMLHARVGGLGSLQHTVVLDQTGAALPPGFEWQLLRSIAPQSTLPAVELIDHLAVCLPAGAAEPTAATYQFVFGMQIIGSERVEVGDTAMNGRVLRDGAGLTVVMAEPDPAHGCSQVTPFLARHGAAGVQHVAFLTGDIVAAMREYGARGVEFVPVPPAAYCQALAERVADVRGPCSTLAALQGTGVLLDRDHDGALYQIFTSCPHEHDTLFYKLVERQGSTRFGTNNIAKAARSASGSTRDEAQCC